MENHPILKKFTSRKFLAALAPVITGILVMIFGHEQEISVLVGAAAVIIPSVVYCIVEGRLDSKALKSSCEAAAGAAKEFSREDVAQIIEDVGALSDALSDEEDEGK